MIPPDTEPIGDTADKIGNLEDCLFSTINRAKIAMIISKSGNKELLPTVLEDLFYGTQMILDNFCIKRNE